MDIQKDCRNCIYDSDSSWVFYDPEFSSVKVKDCYSEYYDENSDSSQCGNFEAKGKNCLYIFSNEEKMKKFMNNRIDSLNIKDYKKGIINFTKADLTPIKNCVNKSVFVFDEINKEIKMNSFDKLKELLNEIKWDIADVGCGFHRLVMQNGTHTPFELKNVGTNWELSRSDVRTMYGADFMTINLDECSIRKIKNDTVVIELKKKGKSNPNFILGFMNHDLG